MRTFTIASLALSTALAAPAALAAQAPTYQAYQPPTTADQLAAVMRRLATAPTDVYALVQAGELSIKLDDMSAAAAFFARADKIDARNGRVKAGMASILVRAERPGEALRYFQMAEAFGLDPARFAADRGLAYDLLGEQERAQRDYRLALHAGPTDDETIRRYALSLGISGRRELALDQLEPLIRRQDRAAWRVRAFVLAMNGDVGGANKIAGTVMPAGMAAGLRPFFERLPTLPASDRAFAVHFGEVRPTPARLADARMKPFLPALGPDPFAPRVQAAAAQPAPVPAAVARDRRRDRRAERRERVQLASARVRVPVPAATGVQPPRAVPQTAAPQPAPAVRPTQAAAVAASPVAVAARPTPAPAPVASRPVQVASAAPFPTPRAAPPTQPSVATAGIAAAPAPTQAAGPPAPAPTLGAAQSAIQPAPQPVAVAAATPSAAAPGFGVEPPAARPAPEPVAVAAAAPAPAAAPGFTAAPASVAAAAPLTAVRSEDSILARIVASITVPGEELGVPQPARPAPAVAAAVQADPAARRALAAGQAKVARETADRAAAARTIAAAAKAKPAIAKPGARGARAAETEDDVEPPRGRGTELAARSRRGRDRPGDAEDDAKPARGRRAKVELAAKSPVRGKGAKAEEDDAGPASRRGADRKAAADKGASAKKDRGEPERIWVQVAGGASDGDLPRAWTAAQRKAAALKGRQAYTTPLRATNRVLTGPFETEAEARAFVNKLARQGVSAFQFTSAKGQKMTKLPAK